MQPNPRQRVTLFSALRDHSNDYPWTVPRSIRARTDVKTPPPQPGCGYSWQVR